MPKGKKKNAVWSTRGGAPGWPAGRAPSVHERYEAPGIVSPRDGWGVGGDMDLDKLGSISCWGGERGRGIAHHNSLGRVDRGHRSN